MNWFVKFFRFRYFVSLVFLGVILIFVGDIGYLGRGILKGLGWGGVAVFYW